MTTFEDSYELGTILGSGAFAEVFTCTAKPHGIKYAVKIIKDAEPAVKVEIDILTSLEHENIVRLIDVYCVDTTIHMVQELISGGEMFDYIIDKGTYSEADACKSFGMILEGLKYLHDKGILHRDLKPENILLSEKSEDAVIKIADFGLAKVISEEGMTSTTCGTPGYVAPEVLRQKNYSLNVDVWAAGVILYIMVSGYEPFYDENETQMFRNIMQGKYSFPADLFEHVSPAIVNCIAKMLVVDPENRPSVADCLADPWLKEHSENQKSKQLDMAKANIAKRQAKKKFKGALIAVRVGATLAFGAADDKPIVDLNALGKELAEAEGKAVEDSMIVKDSDEKAEGECGKKAEGEEASAAAEELPGMVTE